MYQKYDIFRILFAVVVLVSLTGGLVSAATVTQNITYQGKLTDAVGNPLTGTYSVTFKLYDVSSGGTALATDIHSVTASKGLFTTQITADPGIFDGRAVWLGIMVGADPEMTPRQEIRPVPYALGLRPDVVGASFTTTEAGTSSPGIMGVNVFTNFNWNPGVRITTYGNNSNGVHANTYGANSEGVFAYTTGTDSGGVVAHTDGDSSAGVKAQTYGHNSDGVHANTYGANSEGVVAMTHGSSSAGVNAVTEGDYSRGVYAETKGSQSAGVHAVTQGNKSPGIYAESTQDVGVYGRGKTGGFFTTNQAGTSSSISPGVNVSTSYKWNPGIRINTIANLSEGVWAETYGINSIGVVARTYGDGSDSVHAKTFGGNSNGVNALTEGSQSQGVFALTEGSYSEGVRAETYGAKSPAIYGISIQDVGVYGKGKEGGYFTPSAAGSGYSLPLAGVNITTSHLWNPGVRIKTIADSSYGAWITTQGAYSPAVYAIGNGDHADGVQAYAFGPYGNGVLATSNQSYAILADTNRIDHMYGVYTPDYMSAARYDTNSGDVAEYMPVTENVTPGIVLVIGNTGTLESSTIAYDTRVAGIVSTEPGVSLGTKEEGNNGEELIAVAGRVPCKVDAKYGAIHPGDLLSTSDTPGHAMKAEPIEINGRTFYPSGIVLGKAMGSLESGTGTIEVLVTLQ